MLKGLFVAMVSAVTLVLPAENLIRNGGFDHPVRFNGSFMRLGAYDRVSRVREMQKNARWKQTPFAFWWSQFAKQGDISVTDGGGFLRAEGKGVIRSTPAPFRSKSLLLTLDVRTRELTGGILIFESVIQKKDGNVTTRSAKRIALPRNTNGKNSTLQLPLEDTKDGDMTTVILVMSGGTLEIDNVQITAGTQSPLFNVRPQEMLSMSLGKFGPEKFPRFYAGIAGTQKLTVKNLSRRPLSGTLNIYLDQHENGGKTLAFSRKVSKWKYGKTQEFQLDISKLAPDGYLLFAELLSESGDVLISKENIYKAKETGSGKVGNSMLEAYNAMRFGVFPNIHPEKLYGVANGMIGQGSSYHGVRIDDFVLGRKLGVAGYHGYDTEDELWSGAVGGQQLYSCHRFDKPEPGRPELLSPAHANALDIYNPEVIKLLDKRAEELGRLFGEGPGYAGLKMRNESIYPGDSTTYPTVHADRAFRAWCREKFGTIEKLNAAWRKNYKSFDEVVQIVSADMANRENMIQKSGGAALDWTANMGRFTPETVKLMNRDPGRAMDWCRWRTDTSFSTYARYRNQVKKYAPDTVVGVNFCWPNFWPNFVMRFWRETDAPMLDVQYTAPITIDLGNTDEMLDILEMAQSSVGNKPIWGIETYIQPSFPADFAPMQNWGLVAHGMTYNYIFSWKAYADVDPNLRDKGTRLWEKPNAPPMWFFIDNDGTRLPAYYTNLRSQNEIADFHKKYNALSIKRINTRTAIYLADDTNEFVIMTTANKPFNSSIVNARVSLAGTLRMAGVTLDYMDDRALKNLSVKKYDTLLVPPAPVMSDEAISAIAEFARQGGTVVLMGPCGVYDPWLRMRKEFMNGVFSNGDWLPPAAWQEHQKFIVDYGRHNATGISGVAAFPGLPGGKALYSSDGTLIGKVTPCGKGKVAALEKWVTRYSLKAIQHTPELRTHLADLIRIFNLKTDAVWVSGDTPERKGYGLVGRGAPYVEVVLREQSPNSRFLFVMNQAGAGSGKVVLADGKWDFTDVISGKKVCSGSNEIKLVLPAFGYRVFHLTR